MSRAFASSEETTPQKRAVDITGRVLAADARRGEFELWLDDGACLTVAFPPGREGMAITALRGHRMLLLRVVGQGEYSPQGSLVRITQVRELQVCPAVEPGSTEPGKTIEEKLAELARNVPEDEWAKLPADLSDQLDHYIYGTPKR